MEHKRICNSDKYIYEHDTIALPVTFSNLPEELIVEGETFFVKSEFHVSLVAIGKIIEKNSVATPDFKNQVIADFCEFVAENLIDIVGYNFEYRLVHDKALKSIILMCDVSGLDDFFFQMNEKYGLTLEVPPTHVTLYTSHRNIGIFVVDSGDIQKMTIPVAIPELFGKI